MAPPIPSLARGPQEIAHSGIREIANLAMSRPGTIRLDVGQPDFDTPDHIRAAGKAAIDHGMTFYTQTAGLPELRELLAAKIERVNGFAADPSAITVGPGGVGVIAAFLAAVLDPGDELLLPDPGWPNYRMMCAWTGTTPRFYRCPPGAGFQPDLDHLESMLGGRVRALVVNSPNNPTGAVYPRETLRAIAEMAARHGVWLLSDECYDEIVFDAERASVAPLADPALTISAFTFSKTYAMTGWRLGYGTGSAAVVDSAVKVLESNSSCVSTITQVAGIEALRGPQQAVGEMVAAYRRRRDLACEHLAAAGLQISRPEGAFYIMASVASAGTGAREFALRLLEEAQVSVAPGSAFGNEASGAVRISLASADADLREGIARMVALLQPAAAAAS